MWLKDFKRRRASASTTEGQEVAQEADRPRLEAFTLTAEEQARLTQRLRELEAEPGVPATRINPLEYTDERLTELLARARWTSAWTER